MGGSAPSIGAIIGAVNSRAAIKSAPLIAGGAGAGWRRAGLLGLGLRPALRRNLRRRRRPPAPAQYDHCQGYNDERQNGYGGDYCDQQDVGE